MDTLTAPRPVAASPLVREVLALYGLGWSGTATPLGSRRWRLDTASGPFVVAGLDGPAAERRARQDAAFVATARHAGIAAPEARRTVDGDLVGRTRTGPVVVHPQDDLLPADDVSPAEMGRLLARLHQVGRADRRALEWWYAEPVGADRWDELVAALRRVGAAFAPLLADRRDELVALAGRLGRARMVQTCHRDVGPATVRRDVDGGLWLVGWDRVGPADPSHELGAVVLRTVGGDAARARELVGAYRAAGGHGRVDGPGAFSMAIADHAHALEVACRRWLASSATADDRRREATRAQALLTSPVRPITLDHLLAALTG